MNFLEQIRKDMLEAIKSKDSDRANILKLSLASFKNAQIKKGEELNEKEQEQILRQEVKKLKDAYAQYTDAGRDDLAEKEKLQLEILESYLPKLMDESEIKEIVQKKASELGVDSIRDMGKLMSAVMQELSGKADGSIVNQVVKEVLNEA